MGKTVKRECAALSGKSPPPPEERTMHMVILGAEAMGRMIIAELACGCGCGVTGELIASAKTLGPRITALLSDHPDVARLIVFMRTETGISRSQLTQWVTAESDL